MGNVASRDIYNKSGPTTGAGLDTLAKNQGAMREGVGMLPPKDVTIQDGAITGFEEAALIVDTEGGAAADDLNVLSDVMSSTEKLHPGMLITLRAKDPARVVTVKNSAVANGINTADGKDIVLSPYWELTLRLVGGKWYEVRGRSGAQADDALAAASVAQSTANNAKAVTDKVTTTPTANGVPQADGDGNLNKNWMSNKADTDLGNIDLSKANVVLQRASYVTGEVATGSNGIPNDDTIPQKTEGTQFLALNFTPKKSTSKLEISVVVFFSLAGSGVSHAKAALFGNNENAIAVGAIALSNAYIQEISFKCVVDAASIDNRTYTVRIGSDASYTVTFNGISSSRFLGGKLASSITITEYAA